MTEEAAALFMAYGSPRSVEEVGPYFTDIRGGRPPTDDELRRLRARYEAVGGRTPLAEITSRQAAGAERLLRKAGRSVRAYVGMKHWHPYVREVVDAIATSGHARIIGVPLAPFYSAVSTEGYRKAFEEAVAEHDVSVTFVPSWHDSPGLLDAWLSILREVDAGRSSEEHVLFTAHSLPKARMPPGDPYEDQLRTFAQRLAEAADVGSWSFAFQSVGMAGGGWLGPDVHERLRDVTGEGVEALLVAPIGFVADNLETLYDLDHELAGEARAIGLRFRRTPVPNDRREFVRALADVVEAAV